VSDSRLGEVLPAAQQGEAWALRVLYDHLAPRVQAYLQTRGASEPEDLTSEVFLTVFPRLSGLTGGAAGLKTFVFSVAHARLVDDLRRRSRREPVSAYEADDDPRTARSAELEGIESIQTERVRHLLGTLNGDQRDVLTLRILGDLTVEQVATILGRSEGAVKQLQRRGLIALRATLQTQGWGSDA
jgi:RNA polymerase sigma-70 factor (ECF subfamily)